VTNTHKIDPQSCRINLWFLAELKINFSQIVADLHRIKLFQNKTVGSG